MTVSLTGIRRARLAAVCALILSCASIPASARQSSSSDSPAQKSSVPRTSTHKHRKAASKTPATSAKSGAKPSSSTSKKKSSSVRTASAGKRSSKGNSKGKKTGRSRGQQKIDSERATSIQQALIREHYLNGEATGSWNQASEDAMRRYQADHGWQSKQVPDSRALIKLGLGPSKDHLLNPESAMTSGPDAPRAQSVPPASQSPAPVSSTPAPGPQTNSPNPQ